VTPVTYRFLDAMGQVVVEAEFGDHGSALAWAADPDDLDGHVDPDDLEEEIQRVEYLGPEGDWRWAGPLLG
jgi:hypothetical protein